MGGLSEDRQEPLEDADQSHALLGGKWVFLGSRFLKFTLVTSGISGLSLELLSLLWRGTGLWLQAALLPSMPRTTSVCHWTPHGGGEVVQGMLKPLGHISALSLEPAAV